jgi:hypothetical protein
MTVKEIENAAIEIEKELRPEDGWWKSSAKNGVISYARTLMNFGMTPDEALETILGIMSMAYEERGG